MEHQTGSGSRLLDFLDKLEQQKADKVTLQFGMNSYMDQIARERGIPLNGTFELTPLCNLNCKMCYVHLSKEQLCSHAKKQLTGAQWIEIMQQAIDRGMMFALLTGGEAMLHPEFENIYLFLLNHGVQVSVNTNGLLLDEKRIAFFQKHRPREIHVTLYGANDDIYEKVTGYRAFNRVKESILRVKDAGLPIVVYMTPNRYMPVEDALSLVAFCDSLGISHRLNSALSRPREETGRAQETHDMSMDEYIDLYKRITQLRNRELQPFCDEMPRSGGNVSEELKGFRCGGGRSSFAMVWHGIMQACLTFENVQVDVLDVPFVQAWKQVNQAVLNYPIPRECSGCAYESLCPVCVAQHAEDAPLGHASPRLCEKVRRMVRDGLISLK